VYVYELEEGGTWHVHPIEPEIPEYFPFDYGYIEGFG
jgi:hypothetical protein